MRLRAERELAAPALVALVIVGAVVGGLVVGYEPVGGDPDRLYRPIKTELARSLADGRLPFWSDRFGLGVPLVAESHAAAFYPPNWIAYAVLDVSTAYRLLMWLHYLALAGATYLYARRLDLSPWGSALAAVAFALCGFQAIHSSHEPLYSALPFLPLALCFVEDHAARPRTFSLAMLALTFGAQLTLGHFQIALWTACLVIGIGAWRSVADRPARRVIGLATALVGGAAIAAVQLVLTWDYARISGVLHRSVQDLMFYSYPPGHWAELAIPRMFQGLRDGPEGPYWLAHATTAYEACLYVGTLPLVLACVGAATGRDRALAPWRFLAPASFVLATLPAWWPAAYRLILTLPGIGSFRAPARYTLITSLALALLAGRGFDRALSARRFAIGIGGAVAFAFCAAAWAVVLTRGTSYGQALTPGDLQMFLVLAAFVWTASLVALLLWRARRLPSIAIVLITATELGLLYYRGTTVWGWSIALPDRSPVLQQLAAEDAAGSVIGNIDDLPVFANRAAAFPYLGMPALAPLNILQPVMSPVQGTDFALVGMLVRLGATHGIWDTAVSLPGAEIVYAGPDEALDRVARKTAGAPAQATWQLVRYAGAAPAIHVAVRAAEAPDSATALRQLARDESASIAWFLPGDRPRESGPRARAARVLSWDGSSGEVEHDGDCDVVIRRSYAPGWTARLAAGMEIPVVPVDGGLQSVRLSGSGRTRFTVRYRPPHLLWAAAVSLIALVTTAGLAVRTRRSG